PGGGPESRGRGVDAWPGRRGAVPGALQVPGTGEAGRVATRWALPLGCAMVFPAWRGPGCGLWPYPGYAAGASPRVGVTAGLRNGYFQRGGAPDAAFGLIRATRLARRRALGVTAGLRNGHFQRGGAPDAAFGLIRATRLARRHALGVTAGLRNGHFQRGGTPDAAFGLIRATRLARRHAWALPPGCAMGISSVAGPRMRPSALSGLRGCAMG